jgi:hypothetical protein
MVRIDPELALQNGVAQPPASMDKGLGLLSG